MEADRTFVRGRLIGPSVIVIAALAGPGPDARAIGPGAPEACCFTDGMTACADLEPADCVLAGGTPQGTGTSCAFVQCPEACCLADGTCADALPSSCEAAGGTPLGPGTTCDAVDDCAPYVERAHPGWNKANNGFRLTMNQPAYWSALTGDPMTLARFTVLDPGDPPGRPANDGTDDRVLRGYMYAWAVTNFGEEIRWNHLRGDVTIVNYRDQSATEYGAFSYAVNPDAAPHGQPTGTPGFLHLDGAEYAVSFDHLLLNFQAAGSTAFSTETGTPGMTPVVSDTNLTLHPVPITFLWGADPVTTRASIDIWNENEFKFSGTGRCITCWDQTLLSRYETPNHFLRAFLQTDHGKARIDGIAANACDVLDDPATPEDETVTSEATPLLGVHARHLAIGTAQHAVAGGTLVGMGVDPSAVVRFHVPGPPDESQEPGAPGVRGAPGVSTPLDDQLVPLGAGAGSGPGSGSTLHPLSGPTSELRVSATEKGSLIVFPKIELRWDREGNLVQDTFLSLTNDYPGDVWIKLYIVNGDPPLPGGP